MCLFVCHYTIRGVNDIEGMSGVELTPKGPCSSPVCQVAGDYKGTSLSPPLSVGVIGGQSGGYKWPKSVLSKI